MSAIRSSLRVVLLMSAVLVALASSAGSLAQKKENPIALQGESLEVPQPCAGDVNQDQTRDIQDLPGLVRDYLNKTLPDEALPGLTSAIKDMLGTSFLDTECAQEGDVLIYPDNGCIEIGEQRNHQAEVIGTENQSVTWEARQDGEAVPIGADGTFVGSEPGFVEITARSVEFPGSAKTVAVKVGGCDCWWTVDHEDFLAGAPGDQAIVAFGPFPTDEIVGINLFHGGQVVNIFPTNLPHGIPVGESGPIPVKVAGNTSLPANTLFLSPEGSTLPVLTLYENKTGVLRGSVRGTVLITEAGNPDNDRLARLWIHFDITHDPVLSIPMQSACEIE